LGYQIYRITEGQPEPWTALTPDPDGLTYQDNLTGLPAGVYQYAVKVKYQGGVLSTARLSNVVPWGLEAAVTASVITNSGDPVTGAQVILANHDGNPNHTYYATLNAENVVFPAVWKGTYDITIILGGFETFIGTGINILNDVVSIGPFTLTEIIEEPSNLEIDVNNATCSATLSWGYTDFIPFHDDVESYENFINQEIGDYTTVDLDGLNTYVWDVNTGPFWENMGAEQAWIVFNPLATTPPFNTIPQLAGTLPHSGSKYFGCFSSAYGPVNDWLILPKLKIISGVHFKFWAKSSNIIWGPDRLKVGISTTGTNAPSDFTIISSGNYIAVPGVWTEYSFDLSIYNGQNVYIALNCISDDQFLLMIDDISVDVAKKGNGKSFSHYNVYLDNEKVDETADEFYVFHDLPTGDHTAGVSRQYTTGESAIVGIPFASECVAPSYNVTFTVVDDATNASIPDATIVLDGDTLDSYTVQKPDGTYSYTVTKTGYETATGDITVAGENITQEVRLVKIPDPTYTVTFIVTGIDGITITDATIEFDGETLPSYVVENILAGEYAWKVSKTDYITKTGTVTVVDSDVEVAVSLAPVGIGTNLFPEIVLSPNPFKNEINISNPEMVKNVQITTLTGQNVKNIIFNGTSISTGELASGIYFVTIEGKNGEKGVYKMIKD
jgi:hypothetical protein